MTILIITSMDDVHADAVISRIEERRNAPSIVRLNTDNLTTNLNATVGSPGWDGTLVLSDSCRATKISDIGSIWYRKPGPIRSTDTKLIEPARQFIADEHSAFHQSLVGLLADKFWVSNYWNIRKAGQKLPNLRLASALGLVVPRTLVTNDPDEALRFCESCSWKVLAKPFVLSTFKLSSASSTSWDSFATPIDANTFEQLQESIRLAPTMLQEYVDKDFELRVTVIGRQVFATAIDSQNHDFATHDWRAVDAEELAHEPFSLPPDIEEKLVVFNRYHGLQFSTFDIIVNPEGQYVWLECNPNGQWLWLETLAGQPLSAAMAELLVSPEIHGLHLPALGDR